MHTKYMQNQGVKLVANDRETVHFLSTLLQDGISCMAWILFKNNTLKILINRVCWETPKEIIGGEDHIARLHSIVTIHHVKEIKTKQISKKKIEFFSVLSIICDEDTGDIKILFSKGMINIKIEKFLVTMKDVSTYWLTSKIPHHSS